MPGAKRRRHQRWTRAAGAVTVVGLLAFLGYLVYAMPSWKERPPEELQEEGCRTFLDGIAGQVRAYAERRGRLPAQLSDLRDPELDSTYDAEPWDCWSRPIEYRILDAGRRKFTLRSCGPDLEPGTADDIVWPFGTPWS